MDRTLGGADRPKTRARLALLFAVLVAINAAAWIALLTTSHSYPLLLALGVTAYVLGLRHAVDPDHIAAIDATTRKLMRSGDRSISVGFFFSLGHSTIVFILSAMLAAFGMGLKGHLPSLQSTGSVVGTLISALFLLVIGAANVVVLIDLVNTKGRIEENDVPVGGALARILRPALRLVTRSWHMYPVGVLFGLGFDTATEIALLGISAASAAGGMPIPYILILPLLFVAGMSLVDTTEGVAMLGAYSWAYVEPARKFAYNLNMTLFSVIISLFIGAAQALAVFGLRPAGGWLSFTSLSYMVLGVFGASLAVSALLSRTSAARP